LPLRVPESFSGGPTVLLIGYKQSSQFDIDRWVMGLMQAKVSPLAASRRWPSMSARPSMASAAARAGQSTAGAPTLTKCGHKYA
jgi:hypothetical protein